MTPLIFTRKQTQVARTNKNIPQFIVAFENYLSIVAMLYYKKDMNISELLIIPESVKENATKTILVQNPLPKKESKPGRKAKN